MTYRMTLIVLCLICVGCKPNVKTYIPHLEGYWEIASVTLPNGEKKAYSINQTIDFISITNNNGFRKKLKVVIDDKYQASKNQENFTIKLENDSLNLYYETPYSKWKETVLKATQSELLITNTNKVLYLYKRYKPII